LSTLIRFINDVLLSAPSIIIGLFIYEIVVVKMGHFSAIAGALALAVLAIALNNQFWSTQLNAPMANLPVVIFQFALSPYKDWQNLAWAGALIITVSILILSISARILLAVLQTERGSGR
jgi:ABC-type phosphate transport system permease subunit